MGFCEQSNPWSGPGDCLTRTSPDCEPLPTFDTIWIAALSLGDVVLTPHTMSDPTLPAVAPVAARSSETPPSSTNRLASLTSPDWNKAEWATSISYQRTIEPAPPAIVWDVQMAHVFEPWAGSMAATAWVRRPSRVSRKNGAGWGAGGGGE